MSRGDSEESRERGYSGGESTAGRAQTVPTGLRAEEGWKHAQERCGELARASL